MKRYRSFYSLFSILGISHRLTCRISALVHKISHNSYNLTLDFRISSLEIFDEIEEWQLLADHYCVAWAYHAKALSQPDMEHRREQLITLLFNSVRFTDRK